MFTQKALGYMLEHLLIDHMRIAGLQWKVGGEQVQDSMSRLQTKFNLWSRLEEACAHQSAQSSIFTVARLVT